MHLALLGLRAHSAHQRDAVVIGERLAEAVTALEADGTTSILGRQVELGPDSATARVRVATTAGVTGEARDAFRRRATELAGEPVSLRLEQLPASGFRFSAVPAPVRGMGTFPVRVGEAFARRVDQAALILIYVIIAYLVFVPRYFTPVMLIVFLAFKHALTAIKVLNSPRPSQAPEGWPAWPAWCWR